MNFKFLLGAFLVVFSCHLFKAHAAASFITSWTTDRSVTSTADFSLAQSITPTSGNLLVLFVASRQDLATTPTISGWNYRGNKCSPVSSACIYSFSKIATGSETVSVLLDNQDNPNSATLTILEYSGAVNILNSSNTSSGTSNTVTTGTISTSNNNELLIAMTSTDSNTNHSTWTNSFVQRVNHLITGSNRQLKIVGLDRLTNTIGSYSTGTTFNKSENWATMIFNFATTESTSSDLQLTKTVTNTNPGVGQTFSYTITLTNNGARNNTGVQVIDTMPSGITINSTSPSSGTTYNSSTGIWNVGNIDAGQSKTLTISAYPTASLSGASVVNTGNITVYDVTDPNTSNNSSSITINVKQISASPILNTPIVEGDTTISGTSSDTEGAEIYVYNNGTLIGNSTLSGGTWAASVVTVSGGNTITAKSVVAGCCESNLSTGVTVLYKTAIPSITVPVYAGVTLIKGVTSEANGTNIEVFLNNVLLGSTTSSGGGWELTIPKSTLQTGEKLKVRATASGKYVSGFSGEVTVVDAVSPVPAVTTPIVAGDVLIRGSSIGEDGTVIEVFKTRSGATNSIGATTVSGNLWILSGIASSEIRSGDSITAKARIDTNNDGVNNSSDIYSNSSLSITATLRTSQTPFLNHLDSGDTLISGGSAGPDGTLIKIYKNNVFLTSTTVTGNVWSVGSASLIFGDEYKATATYDNDNNGVIDGSDTESGFSSTVTVGGTPVTQVPVMHEPITAGDQVVHGETNEANGTIIQVYVGGVLIGSTASSELNWSLSIAGSTLQTGEVVTAKATATGKSESNLSSGIAVVSRIPPTPIVNQAKAGATTITGSVIPNGNMIIEVLVNSVQVATTSVSTNSWSVNVGSAELQTGEIITARTHIDYNNDGNIELDDASSALSPGVAVVNRISPIPTLNPIGLNTKVITGNLSPVAITKIFVYRLRDGVRTLLGTTQTQSPNFSLSEVISNPWQVGDSITATSITDTNNDGVVNDQDIQSIDSEFQIIFDDSVFQSTSGGGEDESKSCGSVKPNGKPTIYRIEPIGSNKLKIYFNPLNHPRDGFEFEYLNLQSTFKNKSEVKNYNLGHFEIKDLFAGNSYNIRIRAVNGCSKGEWSESKKGVLGVSSTSLPSLGEKNLSEGLFSEPFKSQFLDEVLSPSFEKPFQENQFSVSSNNLEGKVEANNNWIYYLISSVVVILGVITISLKIRKKDT